MDFLKDQEPYKPGTGPACRRHGSARGQRRGGAWPRCGPAARFRKPLGELFSKAIAEISLGSSREAAFRGISETLPFNELKSFTGSIIQAERLGTSIAAVLRSQAASLRKHRRLRAEEHARKAPVKILFPLVIFIFPSIFVIILGPAMIEIIASLKL